jgi:hypothetical protein
VRTAAGTFASNKTPGFKGKGAPIGAPFFVKHHAPRDEIIRRASIASMLSLVFLFFEFVLQARTTITPEAQGERMFWLRCEVALSKF